MKTYRATFEVTDSEKKIVKPDTYSILGFGVRVLGSFYSGNILNVDFQVLTPFDSNVSNQAATSQSIKEDSAQAIVVALPLAAIAVGLIAVAGLAFLYYNFREVHEIIESPQGSILTLGILALAGFIAWKMLK